jgi:hypothetical protein
MGRVYDLPEHMLTEINVKLPRDLVEWLEEIAKARGETIDEVLTWTLGLIRNYYERWMRAWKRLEKKRKH